ncbi:MAG: hypothetical protein Q7P63_08305 [Verrucomicrobiota bacterium JB022]|nr:hypothetical protein [Verrucomicrobiota bacterium JB022]
MPEIIREALAWYNLPLTILLGLVLLYWLVTLLGIFDFDLDFGGDVDADISLGGGFFKTLYKYFDLDVVPLSLFGSICITFAWFLSMLTNYYFNHALGLVMGFVYMGGSVLVSLFLTKAAMRPLRPWLRQLAIEGTVHEPMVGKICTVRTGEVTDSFGQGLVKWDGREKILQIRLVPGSAPLKRGDEALIIEGDDKRLLYYVQPWEGYFPKETLDEQLRS